MAESTDDNIRHTHFYEVRSECNIERNNIVLIRLKNDGSFPWIYFFVQFMYDRED